MNTILRCTNCLFLTIGTYLTICAQTPRIKQLNQEYDNLIVNSYDAQIIQNRLEYMSLVEKGSDEWFDAANNIIYFYCMGSTPDFTAAKSLLAEIKDVLGRHEKTPFAAGMSANAYATFYIAQRDFQNGINSTLSAYQYAQQFPVGKKFQKADILCNFASLLQAMGKYKEALISFGEAESLLIPLQGNQSIISLAGLYCSRGVSYRVLGETTKAIADYKKAEQLFKSIDAKTNIALPVLYSNFQSAYKQAGDPTLERYYSDKALTLAKKIFGKDSYNYASILISRSGLNESDWNEMMLFASAGKEILEKLGMTANTIYYTALQNIGVVYNMQGEYKEAFTIHQRLAEIMKADPQADPHLLATVMTQLAAELFQMDKRDQAIISMNEAQRILKTHYGTESDGYLSNLISSAILSPSKEAGIKMLNDIEDQVIQSSGRQSRRYMHLLTTRGSLASEVGNYSLAITSFKNALSISDKLQLYSEKAGILYRLGNCYAATGKASLYGKANEEAKQLLEKTGLHNMTYFTIKSGLVDYYGLIGNKSSLESEMRSLISEIRNAIKVNLSYMTEAEREAFWKQLIVPLSILFTNTVSFPDIAYDAALMSKGLLLSSSIELEKIAAESDNPAIAKDIAALRSIRSAMAITPSDSLQSQARIIEERLAIASKEYGNLLSSISYDWKDVQKCLKNGDIAVEFLAFRDAKSPVYACIAIMKGWDKPRIMFASADKADAFSRAINSGMPEIFEITEWYQALWGEVTKHISPNANIYFAPDGVLHKAPMEYFPINESGLRMCDIYKMHRLSSTRELISSATNKNLSSAVIFGGLDYNLPGEDMEMRGETLIRSSLPNQEWTYLPGTLSEANMVAKKLKNAGLSVTLTTGEDGVETSFKLISGKSPSIIHLATHGIHTPEPGLVFAGANNGYTSGILTASEISLMDLRNTKLVVLSACATGLGQTSHEGVFGLQRAFKKAGAQSIIMSLWDVDDVVTANMMNSFYISIAQGTDPEKAFFNAQAIVRGLYPEFTKWGAFVFLK